MIDEALSSAWHNGLGRPAAVIVGPVRNETLEHIPTQTFTNDLQRALAGSGRIVVVAAPDERDAVRAERADQQGNARPSTRAVFGAETGADVMLGGVISSIEDRESGNAVYYYQVDLSLTDLETNEKVWLGQKKLKKVIARGRYKV
jgi:PBP1b-binding outer membrane lipoprotein LpoB